MSEKREHSQCCDLLAREGYHLSSEERDRWKRMLADWSTRLEYPGYSNMLERLEGCIEQSQKTREFADQVALWLTQTPEPAPTAPEDFVKQECAEAPEPPSPWCFLPGSRSLERGTWKEINVETGEVVVLSRQMGLVTHSWGESSDGFRSAGHVDVQGMVTTVVDRCGTVDVPQELADEYAAAMAAYTEAQRLHDQCVAEQDRLQAQSDTAWSKYMKDLAAWRSNPVNLVHARGWRVEDGKIVGQDCEGYERVLNIWSIDQL